MLASKAVSSWKIDLALCWNFVGEGQNRVEVPRGIDSTSQNCARLNRDVVGADLCVHAPLKGVAVSDRQKRGECQQKQCQFEDQLCVRSRSVERPKLQGARVARQKSSGRTRSRSPKSQGGRIRRNAEAITTEMPQPPHSRLHPHNINPALELKLGQRDELKRSRGFQPRCVDSILKKRRRQVHVVGMPVGWNDIAEFRSEMKNTFCSLPEFEKAYAKTPDPILKVHIPANARTYFFVDFLDEALASTAILMSGMRFGGRCIHMVRPHGYAPPSSPALDVTPLRSAGLLPVLTSSTWKEKNAFENGNEEIGARTVLFSNLVAGEKEEQKRALQQLLTPACKNLSEYDATMGDPITRVHIHLTSMYCFVQFQNRALASRVARMFDGFELNGRRLKVKPVKESLSGAKPNDSSVAEPHCVY